MRPRFLVPAVLAALIPGLAIVFYYVGPSSGTPDADTPRMVAASSAPSPSSMSSSATPASTLRATLAPAKSRAGRPGTGQFQTVAGDNRVIGTAGTVRRFCIQVEEGTGVNPSGFANAVIGILSHERSWIASKQVMFQWMPSCAGVKFTIRLAFPKTVDRLCTSADTAGRYSCWSGYHVLINLDRWKYAVPHYNSDLTTYRQYVVNHEVGHSLGNQHVPCSGSGNPAAVMVPQTISLQGCARNGWPYDADGKKIQ